MKVNKLLAFVLVVLTITLLGNQLLASTPSQAAPLAGNGITATLSQPASNQPTDQSPTRLTVQGRLTTPGGLPVTTATNFAFKLYNVASGGTALYSEPTTSITPDASGLFTFEFGADGGSFASIFSGSLYLGVTIASDAEMTPRIKVNGAAYAFSLAPGAVISGSYPGVDYRNGVVNAINTNTSNFTNAGLYARGATAVLAESSTSGSTDGYAGYFYNFGGGTGLQYGIYAYGPTYSAYFGSPSSTSTSVYAVGAVSAQSFIDRPGAYSIMVRYNGTTPLQAGEVLAFDGNNPTVDGTQYVGTSKATAATAALAVGVASQRMARPESDHPTQPTSKDGQPAGKDSQPAGKQVSWTIDQAATSFQPGDMIRVVVLGQVQVKASTAKFGDHLGLSASGDYRVAATSDERIGTVISQPDKDGKVTLFVNFK